MFLSRVIIMFFFFFELLACFIFLFGKKQREYCTCNTAVQKAVKSFGSGEHERNNSYIHISYIIIPCQWHPNVRNIGNKNAHTRNYDINKLFCPRLTLMLAEIQQQKQKYIDISIIERRRDKGMRCLFHK